MAITYPEPSDSSAGQLAVLGWEDRYPDVLVLGENPRAMCEQSDHVPDNGFSPECWADAASQVVVEGRPVGHLTAAEYHDRKPALRAGLCVHWMQLD